MLTRPSVLPAYQVTFLSREERSAMRALLHIDLVCDLCVFNVAKNSTCNARKTVGKNCHGLADVTGEVKPPEDFWYFTETDETIPDLSTNEEHL